MTEPKQTRRERIRAEFEEARLARLHSRASHVTFGDDMELSRRYAAKRLVEKHPLLDAFSKLEVDTFGRPRLVLTCTIGNGQQWAAYIVFDEYWGTETISRIDDWLNDFERRLADMVNH